MSKATANPRRATMRQVAHLAGVAAGTVSDVLNDRPARVGADARQRIARAAQRLGYQRQCMARAIKTRLRHLGVVVGGLAEDHGRAASVALFHGVRLGAQELGYVPVIEEAPTATTEEACAAVVKHLFARYDSRLLDGIVLEKPLFVSQAVAALHQHGIPVIAMNGSLAQVAKRGKSPREAQASVPTVNVDDCAGAQLATRYLLELGHAQIAMITPPHRSMPTGYRIHRITQMVEGFKAALRGAGLVAEERWMVEGDPLDRAHVGSAVERLLGRTPRPTALFVADDAMAVLVMQHVRERGLRIPGDVSIIGYGDWSVAQRFAERGLTTVHAPLMDVGRTAVRLLCAQLDAGTIPAALTNLMPELVVRATTARRP